MKPMLKATGTKRLILTCDELLSRFAFKFNAATTWSIQRTCGRGRQRRARRGPVPDCLLIAYQCVPRTGT